MHKKNRKLEYRPAPNKYADYELVYMIREKDDNSYDYLLRKYMPIVKRMAVDYYRCYSMYGYDLEDFIQEGLLGFQNAVNSFNEDLE